MEIFLIAWTNRSSNDAKDAFKMATRGSTTKLISFRKELWFLRNASRILLFARFLSTAHPNLREAMIPSFG